MVVINLIHPPHVSSPTKPNTKSEGKSSHFQSGRWSAGVRIGWVIDGVYRFQSFIFEYFESGLISRLHIGSSI